MTKEQLGAVLADAGCTEANGEWKVAAGKALGIQSAKDGVGVSINRITSLRLMDDLLRATEKSGEQHWLLVGNVIGCTIDGGAKTGRKAGFL